MCHSVVYYLGFLLAIMVVNQGSYCLNKYGLAVIVCHSEILLRVPVGYYSSYLGFLLSKYIYYLRGYVFIYYGVLSVCNYIVHIMLTSYLG